MLVKWLTWFIGLQLATDSQGVERFLKIGRQVLLNVTGLHKICETHGLFLERECAQRLYIHILAVCRGYHQLARQALFIQDDCLWSKAKVSCYQTCSVGNSPPNCRLIAIDLKSSCLGL